MSFKSDKLRKGVRCLHPCLAHLFDAVQQAETLFLRDFWKLIISVYRSDRVGRQEDLLFI